MSLIFIPLIHEFVTVRKR